MQPVLMNDGIAVFAHLMNGKTERVGHPRQGPDAVDAGIHVARQSSRWVVLLKEQTKDAFKLRKQPGHVGALQVRGGLTQMAVAGQARVRQYARDALPRGLKLVPDGFQLLNVDMAHEARARPPAISTNVCAAHGFGQSRPDSVRMTQVMGAFRCVRRSSITRK